MILVSACLAGFKVRYDGRHCLDPEIRTLIEEEQAVSICPEVMGGLSTPRPPAEIMNGSGEDVLSGHIRIVTTDGQDVTDIYIKGAVKALDQAKTLGVTVAVLKENSPSCGTSMIYDGTFNGKKAAGEGVTAALFKRHGIRVLSEAAFTDIFKS